MPFPSFIIPRCGESNEKPCVCNVFATPNSKNSVKSSVPVSQMLRKRREIDNFIRFIASQDASRPLRTFASRRLLFLSVENCGRLYDKLFLRHRKRKSGASYIFLNVLQMQKNGMGNLLDCIMSCSSCPLLRGDYKILKFCELSKRY